LIDPHAFESGRLCPDLKPSEGDTAIIPIGDLHVDFGSHAGLRDGLPFRDRFLVARQAFRPLDFAMTAHEPLDSSTSPLLTEECF
jgi:hypothetical protein